MDRERIWNYERRDFWDSRYQTRLTEAAEVDEKKFDWLCSYESVQPYIGKYLASAPLALDIGCGNADFAAAVSNAHKHLHIVGIDYSSVLFDLCGTSLGPAGRTEWLIMDARTLAFRSGIFDVILDKGCLDALCAGTDQLAVLRGWGRTITEREEALAASAAAGAAQLLREVDRCLAPGGRYICISYEGPSGRQHLWAADANLSLVLEETVLEESSHNYLYIFVKKEPSRPQHPRHPA